MLNSVTSHYNWEPSGLPPVLKHHSLAKHEILKAYITSYILTLIPPTRRRDIFKLVLVDGFAGGGIYRHESTGNTVLGSPFIMLEAVKEAEAIVNTNRSIPVKFDADFVFIEKTSGAFESLSRQLQLRDFGNLVGKNIHLFKSVFQDEAEGIKKFILSKSKRGARSIFVLDQYGYGQVPAPLIRDILSTLSGAEVLLTFAVDAFLTYASDDELTNAKLRQLGVPDFLRGMSIQQIKDCNPSWRLFIQSCLHQDLVKACGARYFTPFFIRSERGHGDYWLIHLSQRPRARDVMTKIHWDKYNHFIHYGGPGLSMFSMPGYVPSRDENVTGQLDLGFNFDSDDKLRSVQSIARQLPDIVYGCSAGITFGDLFANTCNTTPAHTDIYREAAGVLMSEKDIEVVDKDGRKRRSYQRIHDDDRFLRPSQFKLFT